jgi:hypothetical protein
MTAFETLMNRRRLLLQAALFVFIASLYLVTYSGRIESGDSLRLFDGMTSLADYGDFYLDLSAFQFPPDHFDPSFTYPLQTAGTEPMQMLASLPLYVLAKLLPSVGIVHLVWLFNILIGAATCCLLFSFALTLGYSERAAVAAAIALGAGTILWAYSKTFFREPLMGFLLLLTAFFLERLRQSQYRSVWLMVGTGFTLLALTLTKASALSALPALALIALPSRKTLTETRTRRLILLFFIGALVVGGVFLLLGVLDVFPGLSERYSIFARLGAATTQNLGVALASYLLTPGASLWGTSPVLLLALPGAYLLARKGKWRYVLAGIVLVAVFAVGYALVNGVYWFGGLSWPPRFLVPVVPFLMLLTLPVFERLLRRPITLWLVPAIALFAYSVWIQFNAVSLNWADYLLALPAEANGYLEWEGGMTNPAYFRWVVLPSLWSQRPFDIAWSLTHATGFIWAFALLAAAALVWLIALVRRPRKHSGAITAALLIGWFSLAAAGFVHLYHYDERYRAYDESLFAMLPVIASETGAEDVILISSPGSPPYQNFFMNYGEGGGRVIALPLQPGDQPSPEQPPQVVSDNPDALLTRETVQLITNLALTRERLWLLVDGGPDLWWSLRPVEQYMNAHYYPIRTIATGPTTRLIEYSTTVAPDPFAFRSAEHTSDLEFGETIRLIGVDLPDGLTYHASDALPLSLNWLATQPLDSNYTVAVYLRDMNGAPIGQYDSQPNGGFSPTSGWIVNAPIWDNRAFRLPNDLPAGEYQLWVKVYQFAPDGTPQDLTVTGSNTLDGVIGVLPVTITVTDQP